MKLFSLNETLFEPVSHDPQLKKRVITRGTLPCVTHVSHIILQPGFTVSAHTHHQEYEVMYCIRGKASMTVNGEEVIIAKGNLMYAEPGDSHSFDEILEETELLYFVVKNDPHKKKNSP
ncbi:MAG: cupin domain-containing protein [Nitrospirota bacterium]